MSSPSSEISSFRPRRTLFGYERKSTDKFLEHVAELLEKAGERLEEVESELAEHREKEQSLNEALLAVARSAETIKHAARSEAEAIQMHARRLDEFVAQKRSQMSVFLEETLESLEKLSDEIHAGSQVTDTPEEETKLLAAPETPKEVRDEMPTAATADSDKEDGQAPDEGASIFERLRPYKMAAPEGAQPTGP